MRPRRTTRRQLPLGPDSKGMFLRVTPSWLLQLEQLAEVWGCSRSGAVRKAVAMAFRRVTPTDNGWT